MFLSVENIKTLKSNKYISEEDFKEDFKITPQKGDIFMTRIGDIGTSNIVLDNMPKAYYVSLALLKPKNINSFFLNESLSSFNVKKELWKRTLHIAFPKKINKIEIEKVYLQYPNVDEQIKIGNLLHLVNKNIVLYQRKPFLGF